MTATTLSLTQEQAYVALQGFLLSVLPDKVEVIRGQVNFVPEPNGDDFVVMTEMRLERLATNEEETFDNIVEGDIAGNELTVSEVSRGMLSPGLLLLDESLQVAPGTIIQKQLTGPLGGVGTYRVLPAQTVPGGTLYAGEREDFAAREWTVQCDVHGPASADNVVRIETLFRGEVGYERLRGYGFDIAPLYCETAQQRPFINAEQNYEYRWSVDLALQINPVVGTPQQFADELEPTLIEVDATYR
jgi:hypothetical protein